MGAVVAFIHPPESVVRSVDAQSLAFSVLRALPAALLVVSGDGTTLMANHGACATLERTRAELEGSPIESYLAPLPLVLRRAANDGTTNKIAVLLPSARRVFVGFSVSEVEGLSESFGGAVYAIVIKDITSTERLREEHDRLLQVATINELMPAILHEVKNPLASIAAATELLAEETEDPQVRASARAIMGEVQRMKLNIEGVGSVGRKLRSPRPMPIDGPIREAFVILEALARRKGVSLRGEIGAIPALPLDGSVLCAIVYNLVTNSIQACAAGADVLFEVSYNGAARELSLDVEDTGAGMSEVVLSRCRELFFTSKRNGSGIGLALCDRAVTEAGGTMEIETEQGRGTRVRIRVPAVAPPNKPMGR